MDSAGLAVFIAVITLVVINGKNNIDLEQIMAGGWTRDGAAQDQIDASVEDAVKHWQIILKIRMKCSQEAFYGRKKIPAANWLL